MMRMTTMMTFCSSSIIRGMYNGWSGWHPWGGRQWVYTWWVELASQVSDVPTTLWTTGSQRPTVSTDTSQHWRRVNMTVYMFNVMVFFRCDVCYAWQKMPIENVTSLTTFIVVNGTDTGITPAHSSCCYICTRNTISQIVQLQSNHLPTDKQTEAETFTGGANNNRPFRNITFIAATLYCLYNIDVIIITQCLQK